MSDLPEKIRAFIAVRIPDRVRVQLVEVQQQLKAELRDVSWTRPDALHLTLQFLGNIDTACVPMLESALRHATRGIAAFELVLGAPGSFGHRVLWVGIAHGGKELTILGHAVRTATQGFSGHEEDRAFNPHATIGRCRRPARGLDIPLRKVRGTAFQPWTVRDFEVIRSELSPQGSRYTTLAQIPLRPAA